VIIAIRIHQISLIRFQRIIFKNEKIIKAAIMKINGKKELKNTLNKCLLDPKRLSFVSSIKQS